MGYKPWRTLSVLVALSAFTVGCTSGPQKNTGGLGAANGFPPAGKSSQSTNLQPQQQTTQQNFPVASNDRSPQFNYQAPKQPVLPTLTPPGQSSQPFQPVGGSSLNPNLQPGSGNLQQTSLPVFPPRGDNQAFPSNTTVSPPANMNSPAAPNGFATDPRLPPPNNINPGPGFSR